MAKLIYLDNAATTKTLPVVNEAMMEVLEQGFGNPSSKHILGVNAEKYIKDATNTISKILKCNPKEIVYTSCATESNNTAIFLKKQMSKNEFTLIFRADIHKNKKPRTNRG